jgi:hypothetical protein
VLEISWDIEADPALTLHYGVLREGGLEYTQPQDATSMGFCVIHWYRSRNVPLTPVYQTNSKRLPRYCDQAGVQGCVAGTVRQIDLRSYLATPMESFHVPESRKILRLSTPELLYRMTIVLDLSGRRNLYPSSGV